MPPRRKDDPPVDLVNKSSFSSGELEQLCDIDRDRFREWINQGPLNLWRQVVTWIDHPIYPNERAMVGLSGYIATAITVVEAEQLSLPEKLQRKALGLLTKLLPGISAMDFSIENGKLEKYSVKVHGWLAENDDANSWFREMARYDRSAPGYAGEEISEVRGHNKLARISIIAGPQFLRLLNDMTDKQQDEILTLIRTGQVPPQLISDEELTRVTAYNAWMKDGRKGDEPTKPARMIWISSIKEQLMQETIDYASISKTVAASYSDEIEIDETKQYFMTNLDEDTNDLEDIPNQNWDGPSVMG